MSPRVSNTFILFQSPLPALRPYPCHLLQFPKPENEKVDSKGPSFPVLTSSTSVILLWYSFILAGSLGHWLDHQTNSIRTLGNICTFVFQSHFDCFQPRLDGNCKNWNMQAEMVNGSIFPFLCNPEQLGGKLCLRTVLISTKGQRTTASSHCTSKTHYLLCFQTLSVLISPPSPWSWWTNSTHPKSRERHQRRENQLRCLWRFQRSLWTK